VLPELVRTGKNVMKQVSYMELIPVLIEAMKEQQNIIERQQKIYKDKFINQQDTITELLNEVKELKRQMKLINNVAMADSN
jgi:archaellum component FlaC